MRHAAVLVYAFTNTVTDICGLTHPLHVVQEGNDPAELAKSLSETAVTEVSQNSLSVSLAQLHGMQFDTRSPEALLA